MPLYDAVVAREYVKQSTGKTKRKTKKIRFEAGKKDPNEVALQIVMRSGTPHSNWFVSSLKEIPPAKKYEAIVHLIHCETGAESHRLLGPYKAAHDEDPWYKASWTAMHRWGMNYETFVTEVDEIQPDGSKLRLKHNYITVDWERGLEIPQTDHGQVRSPTV